YHSLLGLLPTASRKLLGDVRGVCAAGNGFLFATERMLLAWDGREQLRVVAEYRETPGIRRCFESGGTMYVAGGDGLQQVGGPVTFAGRTIDAVTPHGIVAVSDEGLFTLDGTRYAPAASEWLRGKTVAAVTELADGELAVLTTEDGVLILDGNGGIVQRIDTAAGLPEMSVTGGLYDREGGLWVTASGGIVRIDFSSPTSEIDNRQGLRGAANDVLRFHGLLYVASSHGLFRFDGALPARAARVEGVPSQVWALELVDDELFAGTSTGVVRLSANGPAARIPGTEKLTVYALLRSRRDPTVVWLASRSGIGRLRLRDGAWRYDGLLSHGRPYSRSLTETADGQLWCGTVFDGVLHVGADDSVRQYGAGEMPVFALDGRVLALSAEKRIESLDANGRLVHDPRFALLKTPSTFFNAAADLDGNIWLNTIPPSRLARRPDGTYDQEARPMAAATIGDIQMVKVDEEGVVWFGSDRGLLRFEPRPPIAPQPAPAIRAVIAESQLGIRHGTSQSNGALRDNHLEMPHTFGRLRLEFSPMSFRAPLAYQYRLDPVDADWSRWTEEPFIDYTNLGENSYTLRMRVRGAAGSVSDEVRWRFSVRPPWYRTRIALGLWAVLALALLFLIVRIRTHALQRQAEKLRSRVAEQTIELRETVRLLKEANVRLEDLSSHDELTGVANRRSFERALAEEWELARERNEPIALIMLDLEHFKELNDTHGHQAGDECLRRIGEHLSDALPRDLAARYGGEEFAVLLPHARAADAAQVAERLRNGIERLGIGVTASFGIAVMTPDGSTQPQALIRRADEALYLAKRSGRNCVRIDQEAVA
ncbi:MAG: hypothetical protein JWO56_1069, partial [Acidobacteria bacterium]|nr:hypothetical protein [Acidobacteriota bacterium]